MAGRGRPGGNPNLVPHCYFTKENAKENSIKAVAAHKANVAKRKAMKETLNILLTKAMKKGDVVSPEDIENLANTEKLNISAQDAMAISLVKRAVQGDVQAFIAVRDTVGEKPTDKVEMDQSVTVESWAKTHKVKL